MSDIAIKVQNLSKRYRIGLKEEMPDTLVGAMTAWLKSPIANFRQLRKLSHFSDNGHDPDDIIWALKDVSFKVKQGEVVGIIGRNGAGKSTLLKILSRIPEPTSGRAIINGRVSSLLEVGTGFHPELTGRENVYLNGTVLGMSKIEIDRKFDEIVDFSGVEKFIDTPVKRYSSGMQVRLAFAVAAHLEPEILLVDEVLAVGDAGFQRKCLGKMGEVAKEGRTVLFVSHNMTAVQTLCSRAIRIDEGHLMENGEVNQVVATYLNSNETKLLEQHWNDPQTAPGNENAKMVYAGVLTEPGYDINHLTIETPINLVFRFLNFRSANLLYLNLLLYNQENICVFNTVSKKQSYPKGIVEGICQIPAHFLNDNVYTVWFLIHYLGADGISIKNILTFEIHDANREGLGWYGKWAGVVRPNLEWSLRATSSYSNLHHYE